jgi:hypothetical protein
MVREFHYDEQAIMKDNEQIKTLEQNKKDKFVINEIENKNNLFIEISLVIFVFNHKQSHRVLWLDG